MIGVDTNVLVRFLTADDPAQHRLAADFVRARSASDPAFVSLVALVETIWILRQGKRLSGKVVAAAMSALLSTDDFVFEQHEFLKTLFDDDAQAGSDMADRMIAHVGLRHGCGHTVTFDRTAARDIPSMILLA